MHVCVVCRVEGVARWPVAPPSDCYGQRNTPAEQESIEPAHKPIKLLKKNMLWLVFYPMINMYNQYVLPNGKGPLQKKTACLSGSRREAQVELGGPSWDQEKTSGQKEIDEKTSVFLL